jgi:hypothetical protein
MARPLDDISGKKFGKLTAIRFIERKNNKTYWACICDCDTFKEIIVKKEFLQNGNKKSCGCLNRKNLIGLKFGKWTVINFAYVDHNSKARWNCQCDCGNFSKNPIIASKLTTGKTKSCVSCKGLELGVA